MVAMALRSDGCLIDGSRTSMVDGSRCLIMIVDGMVWCGGMVDDNYSLIFRVCYILQGKFGWGVSHRSAVVLQSPVCFIRVTHRSAPNCQNKSKPTFFGPYYSLQPERTDSSDKVRK